MPRPFDLRAIKTIAAAALSAIVIIIVSLPVLSTRIDDQARDRERTFVAASVARETDFLRNQVGSTANRDPSVRNLDYRFDPGWAESELTSVNDRDISSRVVTVFDADDAVLFARAHAAAVPAATVEAVRQATRSLVGRIREREREAARIAATRRITQQPGQPTPASGWIDDSSTVLILGHPFLVVASLVGSNSGKLPLMHRRAPILLLASDLQATIIPQVNRRLHLFRAALESAGPGIGRATYPFLDTGGRVTAVFSWQPDRPGTTLLQEALLPILVVVGALLGAVVMACRQGLHGTRILMASEARATRLSLHDGLTGLPNRRCLTDRLDRALAQAGQADGAVSILLLNLDRFKPINEAYGYQCGDELIQEVGRRIVQSCHDGEICGRFGGNEFLIIVQDERLQDGRTGIIGGAARRLAERVLRRLAEPMNLTTTTLRATASIGISVSRPGSTISGSLLRQADLALLKAKASGGGGLQLFDLDMDAALDRRRMLERDLREALADGAITVAYQPQFEREQMVGVEALARWTHETLGPISPAVFAPLAEECGLIAVLGLHVMRQAFIDSRRWPDLRVAINVSARQLQMPGLCRLGR
nr:diguanylate cyclase [uncultured Lichenicoccus sp.]